MHWGCLIRWLTYFEFYLVIVYANLYRLVLRGLMSATLNPYSIGRNLLMVQLGDPTYFPTDDHAQEQLHRILDKGQAFALHVLCND